MKTMHELFKIGDVIHGYCNGFFGRDDYQSKICVMVTSQYAVFEYLEDHFFSKGSGEILNLCSIDGYVDRATVEEWKKEKSYD